MGGNLWLYVVMCLTLTGTGMLTWAALSPSWYRVACEDGEWLGIGLWKACRPSANLTLLGMGKDGCGQVDNVLLDHHIPAWMGGARLLAMCAAVSAGTTSLLMFLFCFLPPHATLDSAHGLGGCGLGTAAFCVCTILDGFVGRSVLGDLVDPVMCGAGMGRGPVIFSRGYHLTVGGMLLCMLSGLVATGAKMVFGAESLGSEDEDTDENKSDGDSLSQQYPPKKQFLKFRMKTTRRTEKL